MKKIFLIIVLVLTLINVAIAEEGNNAFKVIVYYFHGSFRCVTCQNMEKYSQEAIEKNFQEFLAAGKLEFKVVNVESKGNEHFTSDYQLYTKSLILSFVQDGKEVKVKNLVRIWEYAYDKQRFISYVTEEIKAFLDELK